MVVVPKQAARALGVPVGSMDWPVVASLKRKEVQRARYCQTPNDPRCLSGHAHEQSALARDYFDKLFSTRPGTKKQHFEAGRDQGGPDRDHTPRSQAEALASALLDELPPGMPPGWPETSSLGDRMQFGHPPPEDAPVPATVIAAAATQGKGKGKATLTGAIDKGARRGRGGRDGRRGGRGGDGRGGKGALPRLGKGGRGTSALAFAAVAAGADADGAGPQPVPGGPSNPGKDVQDEKVPIPGGAVQVKSGSVSRTSLCRETAAVVSFPRVVRNPSMINRNDGVFDGSASALQRFSSTVGCVQPARGDVPALPHVRFLQAAAALRDVVVPIIMSPLTLSSKVVLFMLAISATTAPAILVPTGGGVWGRRAPSSWLGATAMKGASTLASRWAPLLLSSPPTGLTAHYVAAQHLTPRDATCTNWLAVCLVPPGHAGAPGTVWRNLAELEGRPEHVMAAVAAYRGHSLFHSVPIAGSRLPVFSASALATVDAALGPEGSFEVGKRAALPPLAGPSQGYVRESRTFDEMWALHCAEVDELSAVFASPGPPLSPAETLALLGPLTAGFGQVSGEEAAATARAFDAIWAEDCQALRARITVGDAAMIPASLKEPGALASYADAALALAPFSSRCRPPLTVRRAPPLPQAQGPLGPTDFEAFYPPGHFRSKADPWLISQRAYLLDALEHGAAATVEPPEVLVFSDHERLPQYRGRLYEFDVAAGRYVLTDTAAPATTHLNRPFAVQFAADYPDQELFSTLDFGVNFEAENMEMQVVFPRHLLSLAGGLAKVQVDIAERAGHGWYEINSVIPRNPWRPQQIGSRLKPNGKYRVIVNASFPHGDLADGHGIQVQSLNLLSKRSYDAMLGTDGVRMCRAQRRLRTTAGSPPPPSACTLHGDEPCCCGRSDGALVPAMQPDVRAKRPGKVTVAPIQSALSHPWSLHGGRDTILCSPFGGADHDAVYEAYAQYTSANRAGSAFSVAAQHGVRCFPLQARSDPRARASYETVLAAQVARGRSLQLTDRPTQGRSHLHLVAERIKAKASLLYASHVATFSAVSNTGRRVLRLGPVPHSSGLFAEECRLLGLACSAVGASGLLDDSLYQNLMAEASAGVYGVVVATVACDSHLVRARPLRDRALGGAPMPYLTAAESRLVGDSDRTTRRMVAIILAAWRRGAAFLILSPADLGGDGPARGGSGIALDPLLFPHAATHSPLWVQRVVLDLESQTGGKQAHFNMCCLGADQQWMTTILFSHGLARVEALSCALCTCVRPRPAACDHATNGCRGLDTLLATVAAEWLGRKQSTVRWPVGMHLMPNELALSYDDDPPKRPPELKPYITEYMNDDAILKHVCRIVGSFLVTFDDDFRDWFYQLKLMAGCYWQVGFIMLELQKLASELPELRFIVEKVLGQGTTPGSNWGQRLCELVLHMWDVVFAVLDGPHVAEQRRASPELDAWFLARISAGCEARLHTRGGYTDDTRFRFVGPERTRRGVKAWCFVTKGFRTMMADVAKRQLGMHDISLGTCFNNTLGVAFIAAEKRDKSLERLCLLLAGSLAVSEYRSLLGLLLHVSFLAGMRRSATHGMFTPLSEGGALSLGPDTLVAGPHLTPSIRARAGEWRERLERWSGAPFASAVPALARTACVGAQRTFWRSDACKEGTSHPGIAGISTGDDHPRVWVRRLTGDELLLPVPVTEFAGFYGNCCKWGEEASDDTLIVSEVDALVPAFVLTREASASPLMQHVLAAVNALATMTRLRERMTVGHISSEVNVTADLPSRGRLAELLVIAENAGVTLQVQSYPPQLDRLLGELVVMELGRRVTSTTLGSHNIKMDGRPIAHGGAYERVQADVAPPVLASGPQTYRWEGQAQSIDAEPRRPRTTAVIEVVQHGAAFATEGRGSSVHTIQREPPSISAAARSQMPEDHAVRRLLDDTSEFALRPASAARLQLMCGAIFDDTHDNHGSKAKLNSNMKLWRAYCGELNTPFWRPTESGLTTPELEREAILAANFLPWALTRMRGRKGCAQAKPSSAYKAYQGVRKAHSNRNLELPKTKQVWRMCKRLSAKHLIDFGALSLVVKRKQPFTTHILHEIITALDAGPIDLTSPAEAAAFRAFAATLRQTGMRKSELALGSGQTFSRAHATRAHLQWCLRGTLYTDPPPDLLRNPHVGDYAILVPPPSKADPFGEVWGALPIYLHYSPTDPDAAFNHLATLELVVPATGELRQRVPLISADNRTPLAAAKLDRMLQIILRRVVGVANASKYSWHSARIYLACSLLAAGASSAQIQALCRWQTEDSLRVYARLNPGRYNDLLTRAARADVSSVSVASLPPLSSELAIRQLLGLSLVDALGAADK